MCWTEKKIKEGVSTKSDDVYTVLEAHMNLDIPGFEDIDPETQEPTGIKTTLHCNFDEDSRTFYLSEETMQAN